MEKDFKRDHKGLVLFSFIEQCVPFFSILEYS